MSQPPDGSRTSSGIGPSLHWLGSVELNRICCVTIGSKPGIGNADARIQTKLKFMPKMKHLLALTAVAFLGAEAEAVLAQQPDQNSLWQTRCAGPSRAADSLICEASQSIRVKENGKLLFKVDIITPANNTSPVLQMQAPLGFYLPGKVKLAVDGAPLTELEIGTCDQRGCFLSADATAQMIDAMKAGSKLQIDFAPAADRRQIVDVPLTGFTRAMEAIQ